MAMASPLSQSSPTTNATSPETNVLIPRVRPQYEPTPPPSSPWTYHIAYYGVLLPELPSIIAGTLTHLRQLPPFQEIPFSHNLPDAALNQVPTSTSNAGLSESPTKGVSHSPGQISGERPVQWTYPIPRYEGVVFTVTKFRDGVYRYADLLEAVEMVSESQRVNGFEYETSVYIYEKEGGLHSASARFGALCARCAMD